jgi:hypothetical protein
MIASLIILFFISIGFLNLPVDSNLVMVFLFVSLVIGVLFAIKSRIHSGHSLTVLGVVILLVSSVIVAGAIDFPVNGDMKSKVWDLSPDIFTYMLLIMALGFVMFLSGLWVTWKKR